MELGIRSPAAAPIGSWKLKRQKPLASVTALVGGAVGYESPIGDPVSPDQAFRGGWAAGVMAPVGLELSWPGVIAQQPASRWSTGILLSVLDVGQITWSRLEQQDKSSTEAGVSATPDTTLKEVFSPGGYLVIGSRALADHLRRWSVLCAGAARLHGRRQRDGDRAEGLGLALRRLRGDRRHLVPF